MQSTIEKLPQSQVKVTVTVPVAEQQSYLERAASRISQSVKIEGFRPGKAPRDIVEQKVGSAALMQEAADEMVQKTYPEALRANNIRDIGMPHIHVVKLAPGNDFEYFAEVPVMPETKLGDVGKVTIERKAVEVPEEEITKAMEELRKMQGKEIVAEKAAEKGDKVEVDFDVLVDNVPIEGGSSKNHPVVIGNGLFIPGFEEQIIGMKKDEEKEFELEFPKEYHEKNLAGKKATFKVKTKAVYTVELPELNDEFAKKLGQFQSLDQLRAAIAENAKQDKERKEQERLELEVLEKMIDMATFEEIPQRMIDRELEQMLQEFEQQLTMQGANFEDYLSHIKKTKDDLKVEWKEQAEKRVKTSLVVSEVIEQEHLTVTENAVDDEIAQLKQMYGNAPEVLERLNSLEYRAYQRMILLNRKAVDFLVKKALGEDPTAPVVKDGKTQSGILV